MVLASSHLACLTLFVCSPLPYLFSNSSAILSPAHSLYASFSGHATTFDILREVEYLTWNLMRCYHEMLPTSRLPIDLAVDWLQKNWTTTTREGSFLAQEHLHLYRCIVTRPISISVIHSCAISTIQPAILPRTLPPQYARCDGITYIR